MSDQVFEAVVVRLRCFYSRANRNLYEDWFPTFASLGFEVIELEDKYNLIDGPPGLDIEIMSSSKLRHSIPVTPNTASVFADKLSFGGNVLVICTPIPDFKRLGDTGLATLFKRIWESGEALNTNADYEKWAWSLVGETLKKAVANFAGTITIGFCCETSGLATAPSATQKVRDAFAQGMGRALADLTIIDSP